jgi:hypothetical protein
VLEEAFDRLAPDDRVLLLDRLEIDLGRLDPSALDERLLREAILAQLSRQLRALPPAARAPEARILTVEDTLAAFLEIGAWPWQAVVRSVHELEAALAALPPLEARGVARRLLPLLGRRGVRLRLAYQFRPDFVRWLVAQLHPGRARDIERLVSQAGGDLGPVLRAAVALAAAVSLAGEDGAPTTTLARWVAEERRRLEPLEPGGRRGPEPSLPDILGVPPPTASLPPHRETDADAPALYVSCAGVVLLHPFLDRFFRHLGLATGDTSLVSLEQRVRAVHLLHHLATGRPPADEHETTLLKLLGGLPIQYPLPRDVAVSLEERHEAETLLTAAIRHWDKLRNTSPAGLREAFMQREGKLVARPDGWRLIVEQRPVDVLLDSLPWSVSVVRLPWMAAPLWVDWA